MFEQAFTEKHYENTILHSDQGWQYQHDSYHRFLESKGNSSIHVTQRKQPRQQYDGIFLWYFKSGHALRLWKSFQPLEHFEQAIVNYINY